MGQIERAIKAITNLFGSASLIKQSTVGGTQKLTIATNKVTGTSQVCRSCLIHCPSENAGTIYLSLASGDADANDFPIPKNSLVPIPVNNLSNLHFYGTDDDDLIHILWRD